MKVPQGIGNKDGVIADLIPGFGNRALLEVQDKNKKSGSNEYDQSNEDGPYRQPASHGSSIIENSRDGTRSSYSHPMKKKALT